jgi:hypothetical protein
MAHHDGVLELVRETAENVADLVAKHLKLARLEFTEDLLQVVSRTRLIVVLGLLLTVGYALSIAGLAVWVGGKRDLGCPLLVAGMAHLGICGAWMFVGARRLGGMRLMNDTSDEVQRSFATLSRRTNALHHQ